MKTRLWSRFAAGALAATITTFAVGHTDATPEILALKVYHIHTNERATIVFKRNGVYDRAGLQKLNMFLRDWRKEQPTNMDPHLFDLLYQVYRRSGSHDYINIVCGYRSPETNGMLRRRSKGVAEHSQHMLGKAIDFYIPDVPLAKLRSLGMQMQVGGVGFYPTSGSPFVHMDTGSVRMWPRMTRQQLVQVFPNGRTLYIPSDGKPLPGYAEAMADYKARKASGAPVASFEVASDDAPAASSAKPQNRQADAAPLQLASADVNDDDEDDDAIDDTASATSANTASSGKTIAAIASYATAPVPLPNLAPRHAAEAPAPIVVAAAPLPVPPAPVAKAPVMVLAAVQPRTTSMAPDFDFGSPQDWSAPAVPATLARAMAERDQTRRGASLPIPPTAVVATIDVSRPLRAEAITTAVLRSSNGVQSNVPTVLGYADADAPQAPVFANARTASITGGGSMPLPLLRPRQDTVAVAKVRTLATHPHMDAPELMMTSLDTQGLRMWMAPQSTRQKSYALLTMPDFAQMPDLMEKPAVTFGAGFGQVAYSGLRTDRFSGALVQQPSVVDLTSGPLIASIR